MNDYSKCDKVSVHVARLAVELFDVVEWEVGDTSTQGIVLGGDPVQRKLFVLEVPSSYYKTPADIVDAITVVGAEDVVGVASPHYAEKPIEIDVVEEDVQ